MRRILKTPLTEYEEVLKIRDAMKKGRFPLKVTGAIDSQKCHLAAFLSEDFEKRIIITANDLKAKEICADYRLFDREVLYYPPKDIIFYSADIRGNSVVRERMKVIKKLVEGSPVTVVAPVDAGLERLMPLEEIKKNVITIDSTDSVDLKELEKKLVYMGYNRLSQVEAPGDFAVRGGIVDVFPLTEENPYRIELFGDDVDSIRLFDVSNQRSLEVVDQAVIFPAAEIVADEEKTAEALEKIDAAFARTDKALRKGHKNEEATRLKAEIGKFKEDLEYLHGSVGLESFIRFFCAETVSFFEYFADEGSVIFVDEPVRCGEKLDACMAEFRESMKGRLEKGYILPEQAEAVFPAEEVLALLARGNTLTLSALDHRSTAIAAKYSFDLEARTVGSFGGNFPLLCSELEVWKKRAYRTVLVCPSHSRAKRLAEDLREAGLSAVFSEDEDREAASGEIVVIYGNISRGFEYPLLKFAVLAETDIFGAKKEKKAKKSHEGKKLTDYSELAIGDYVVHETYGIGIYRGIEKIEVERVVKDYIKVEYAGGGTLYVLASSMGLLGKFSGNGAAKPKINKLDGVEWKNTKTKVRGAVKELAEDLVKLYALRQNRQGHAFGKDTVWQTEFEELFPYEETDDQLRAIEETKADMESTKIMDRLICGDVGYGKTEIAIRAAFKAVADNKQVVFLVPTTILAQQHFNTFIQRMRDYPVTVEMLSRFKTAAQQKEIIKRVANGQVDILIGTHRVLSKDLSFKRLGLLIIDEEQRFGVSHKEKIKQMKGDVDVLTLTATPIPRTLHMSLSGIRDMSVLDEPPVDRLPIQTFVLEHNDEIIREAINRELARGGQVYYVYNKVVGIDEIASRVAKLVPEAEVAYAHGQMNERQLERIMLSFINGEIDVLVSTTIIETGLDISNVNTIIIDDADRLGLAQLYQLRGRVGRSNRTAYAFLMYKRDKMLKEVAEKRLSAIREFTELGSGFKIAMRDLEIRGAGNLLGAQQSGHMEAVGYDMYCKLLNEAVKKLKGIEEPTEEFDTGIDMEMDAYIPATYIRNEGQKLSMYKRIADIESERELEDLEDELTDRFGDLPACVENLLYIALAKHAGHEVFVTQITQKQMSVKLAMYPKAALDVSGIPEVISKYENRLKLMPGNPPAFDFKLLPPGKADAAKKGAKAKSKGVAVCCQLLELFEEIRERCLKDVKKEQ